MNAKGTRVGLARRGLGVAALAGVLAWVGLSALPGPGAGAEGRRAAALIAPETEVAELRATGPLPEGLRRLMAVQRERPDVPDAALAAARALIAEARRTGDGRLSGAAVAILHDLVAADLPEAVLLAAVARQHQHDFAGAVGLLDRLLATAPDHPDARLQRATLRLVQGDFAAAREDCTALTAVAPAPGFLCLVSTYTLAPEAPEAAAELDRLIGAEGALDTGLRVWALSLAGEVAWMLGDGPGAETALRAALALNPAGQREAVMLADILLAEDRAAEAAELLSGLPATDAVALRRLRAAQAGVPLDIDSERAALEARLAESRALGLTAHAREEGQYLLWIRQDPLGALERAEANWRNQKEFDDALLLLQAAQAGGRPEAAAPVRDWMAQAGLTAPALVRHFPDFPTGAEAMPPSRQGDLP